MEVHLYRTTGERQVVTTTREDARRFCSESVASGSDVYRAAIYDRLSTRYTYDTDDVWLKRVAA